MAICNHFQAHSRYHVIIVLAKAVSFTWCAFLRPAWPPLVDLAVEVMLVMFVLTVTRERN